jgi:caffeoyl-CoA O-methyltransferase
VNQLDEAQDPGALAGWLAAAWRECGNARSAARGLQIAGAGHQPRHQAGTGEPERLVAERDAALREAFSRLSPDCQRLLTLLIDEPPMPDADIGPACRRCLDKLRRDPVIAALTGAGTAPWPTPGRAADDSREHNAVSGHAIREGRNGMIPPAARRRSQFIDAAIDEYAAAHSTAPDAHQRELQRITREKTGPAAGMQVGDDQAVLMEMLVRAMGATRAVEIGTFTGYSALAVARGLGPGGRLLCCDTSQQWTSIARGAWQEAGVADRIELQVGPGLDTLRALPPGEQFDFAFIDADKTGYAQYYEEVLARLRPGGLILLDNTLQGGDVISDHADDQDVVAIRSVNDTIAADPRVTVVLIPIGDGVSIVQKRGEPQ